MAQSRLPEVIQSYNLFGEVGDLPDVVHCETISARSERHNGVFRAHRHARLHQILLIETGGGAADLDGRTESLGPMRFVNVPVGDVHGFAFAPGAEGWVVTMASEVLEEAMAPAEGVRQALSTARTGPATAQIRDTMVQIFAEFAGRRFGRAQVLRGLCALLTALVARELVDDLAQPGIDRSADRAVLLQRFEALIEAHYLEHLGVADYARALAVTPTHLSRVARTATGRSAQQMIQERMIREARRQLVYTGQPVSAVAYALGYADPAYFSRVFSGATGLSPRDFRARVHGEPHAEARLDSVTGEITA